MTIVALPMTPKYALDLIREIAKDSARVVLPKLDDLGPWRAVISDRQIRLCFSEGEIVEGPKVDGVGEFECTLYRASAGTEVWVRIGVFRNDRSSAFEIFVKEVTTQP